MLPGSTGVIRSGPWDLGYRVCGLRAHPLPLPRCARSGTPPLGGRGQKSKGQTRRGRALRATGDRRRATGDRRRATRGASCGRRAAGLLLGFLPLRGRCRRRPRRRPRGWALPGSTWCDPQRTLGRGTPWFGVSGPPPSLRSVGFSPLRGEKGRRARGQTRRRRLLRATGDGRRETGDGLLLGGLVVRVVP